MTTCPDLLETPAGVVEGGVRDDEVQPGTRGLLAAFAGLTALATYRLVVLGGQTEHSWPWTVQNRATVEFLAAAYAAGFVLSVLALRQRSWRQVRVAVTTVTAFTLLTLVPTVLHAHRLHLADPDPGTRAVAWFWIAVYVLVPLVGLLVLGGQQSGRCEPDVVRTPLPPRLRTVLAVQGAVLLTAGLGLFVGGGATHHGASVGHDFWTWALTPLSAQALGAWLIAFGIGVALVLREGDLARLRVPAIASTAFGAFQWTALIATRSQMDGPSPALWAYGALLAVVVLTGGYGWGAVPRLPRWAQPSRRCAGIVADPPGRRGRLRWHDGVRRRRGRRHDADALAVHRHDAPLRRALRERAEHSLQRCRRGALHPAQGLLDLGPFRQTDGSAPDLLEPLAAGAGAEDVPDSQADPQRQPAHGLPPALLQLFPGLGERLRDDLQGTARLADRAQTGTGDLGSPCGHPGDGSGGGASGRLAGPQRDGRPGGCPAVQRPPPPAPPAPPNAPGPASRPAVTATGTTHVGSRSACSFALEEAARARRPARTAAGCGRRRRRSTTATT